MGDLNVEDDAGGSAARRPVVEVVAIAEEVASVLRHDLRNKFASIRNAVFYVQRSLAKLEVLERDPRAARFLELICEQVNAADALLDQRTTYQSLLSTQVGIFRIAACVEAALSRSAMPKAARLEIDLSVQGDVQADFDELAHAIGCLIFNAFEAAGPDGKVSVKTSDDGEMIRVHIEDSGAGMTPEQRERAFHAFASDKPGHAGIGLNIASRTVARYGGRLEFVDGVNGHGTCSAVCLPRQR